MRLLLFLAVLGLAISSGTAHAAPGLSAITIYTASNPAPAGEAASVDKCVGGKPTVKIYFSAKGTGDVEVISSKTTDLSNMQARIGTPRVIAYTGNGAVLPVNEIPAPDDDSEFSVFVVSLDNKTQPAHVRLTATRETCEMDVAPNAFWPSNGQGTSVWTSPWTWLLMAFGVFACYVVCRRPRSR